VLGSPFTHARVYLRSPQPDQTTPRHTSHHHVATHITRIATMSDANSQPPDTNMEMNDELDQTVDDEIKQDATQLETDAMNLDGAKDAEPPKVNGMADSAAAFEARIPAKKDATLREFLGKMDDYAPIVCRALFRYQVLRTNRATRYLMQ
jgi:hypothetical protein